MTVWSAKSRNYYKYVNGQSIKYTVTPTPGGHQKNNPKLTYAIDFDVTPHQLRYITNLLYAGVDPKTVRYLAGRENSKTRMDVYAQVKYDKPEELVSVVNAAHMGGIFLALFRILPPEGQSGGAVPGSLPADWLGKRGISQGKCQLFPG